MSKSDSQIEQEKIKNHGLSDQEQASVQFTAFETFTTIMAKGQMAALASNLSFTGMGAGGKIASAFFGVAAIGPTLGGDLISGSLTTKYDFTSSAISGILTGASLITSDPIDKIIGVLGIGIGNYTTSFEFEKQKWDTIKKTGF